MEARTRGYHPKISRMLDAMDLNRKIREIKILSARKKAFSSWYWYCRDILAFETLRTIDPHWKDWFDNNENVPEKCELKPRALLIEQHICDLIPGYKPPIGKLYKNVFIWRDRYVYLKHSISLVYKEPDFREFVSEADARVFIDTMPGWQAWYGTVIGRNE